MNSLEGFISVMNIFGNLASVGDYSPSLSLSQTPEYVNYGLQSETGSPETSLMLTDLHIGYKYYPSEPEITMVDSMPVRHEYYSKYLVIGVPYYFGMNNHPFLSRIGFGSSKLLSVAIPGGPMCYAVYDFSFIKEKSVASVGTGTNDTIITFTASWKSHSNRPSGGNYHEFSVKKGDDLSVYQLYNGSIDSVKHEAVVKRDSWVVDYDFGRKAYRPADPGLYLQGEWSLGIGVRTGVKMPGYESSSSGHFTLGFADGSSADLNSKMTCLRLRGSLGFVVNAVLPMFIPRTAGIYFGANSTVGMEYQATSVYATMSGNGLKYKVDASDMYLDASYSMGTYYNF